LPPRNFLNESLGGSYGCGTLRSRSTDKKLKLDGPVRMKEGLTRHWPTKEMFDFNTKCTSSTLIPSILSTKECRKVAAILPSIVLIAGGSIILYD
jgi:hypothetical protein